MPSPADRSVPNKEHSTGVNNFYTIVCGYGHSMMIQENVLYQYGGKSFRCRGLIGREMTRCDEVFNPDDVLMGSDRNNLYEKPRKEDV